MVVLPVEESDRRSGKSMVVPGHLCAYGKTPALAGSGKKNSAKIASESSSVPDELDVKIKAFEKERLRVKKIIDAIGTPRQSWSGRR
jgi:hypothetical protein